MMEQKRTVFCIERMEIKLKLDKGQYYTTRRLHIHINSLFPTKDEAARYSHIHCISYSYTSLERISRDKVISCLREKCIRDNIESTIENDLGFFPKCLIGQHCLGAGFLCICRMHTGFLQL